MIKILRIVPSRQLYNPRLTSRVNTLRPAYIVNPSIRPPLVSQGGEQRWFSGLYKTPSNILEAEIVQEDSPESLKPRVTPPPESLKPPPPAGKKLVTEPVPPPQGSLAEKDEDRLTEKDDSGEEEDASLEEEDYTEEDDKDLLGWFENWYGKSASPEHPDVVYERIIDAARLLAERAYEMNGACVGALAEAGGDEGAADRWLRGFLVLIRHQLPPWWTDAQHMDPLLKLAHDRRGNFFIKRCVDPKKLKKRMGDIDFTVLEMIAYDVQERINSSKHSSEEEADEDKYRFVDQSHIAQAKEVWGEETYKELVKLSPEEMEAEQGGQEQLAQIEEGEWYGPATDVHPEEAYKRLLDAARRGTLMAHEQRGDFIGSVSDAMAHYNEQGNLGEIDEEIWAEDKEDDDTSDDDEEFKEDDDADQGANSEPAGQAQKGAEDKEKMGDENEPSADEALYNPTELGPNAKEHFEGFLQAMKDTKTMPPWWNDDHEAALWRLGSDPEGDHFLGYGLDTEEVNEAYGGAAYKVSGLADAASRVGMEDDVGMSFTNDDVTTTMDDNLKQ